MRPAGGFDTGLPPPSDVPGTSPEPPGAGREVLGIAVDRATLLQWRSWLMPEEQPFLVPPETATALWLRDGSDRLTPEVRDAFALHETGDALVCWLDRRGARRLPSRVRAGQPAPHRFPTDDVEADLDACVRVVTGKRRPSRHREVHAGVWAAVLPVAPRARALAGRFPGGSGPGPLDIVMAAFGAEVEPGGAMAVTAFEDWLADATVSAPGEVNAPGTVYVWRDPAGLPVHAALSLGGGYALHTAGAAWADPTVVLTKREAIAAGRAPGRWLHRHLPR